MEEDTSSQRPPSPTGSVTVASENDLDVQKVAFKPELVTTNLEALLRPEIGKWASGVSLFRTNSRDFKLDISSVSIIRPVLQ